MIFECIIIFNLFCRNTASTPLLLNVLVSNINLRFSYSMTKISPSTPIYLVYIIKIIISIYLKRELSGIKETKTI